jgi:hypothetical protein
MSVSWESLRDSETGAIVSGEYVGLVKGEPEIRVFANRYAWKAEVRGVVARMVATSDVSIARYSRRNGSPIDRVSYAQLQAETWVAKLLAERDGGGSAVQ